MTTAKFRAWDKKEKVMITDEQHFIPLIVTNKGVFKLNPRLREDNWILMPIERFELMESTGLFDKNGVEIFKDDVLSLNLKDFADLDGPHKFVVDDFAYDLAYLTSISQFLEENQSEELGDYIEILGNKIQHPELLEDSK